MSFLWPEALALLAAVPLLVVLYVFLLRRKRKAALRYASLDIVKSAMGGRMLRRHIPPLLFLLAIIVGFVALARPTVGRRPGGPGRAHTSRRSSPCRRVHMAPR